MLPDYLKNNNINSGYKLGILLLSFVYAFVLANYIPMDVSIKDRLNYLEYAGASEVIILRYRRFSRYDGYFINALDLKYETTIHSARAFTCF